MTTEPADLTRSTEDQPAYFEAFEIEIDNGRSDDRSSGMSTMTARLHWARYHAALGWPIFPLLADSKRPAVRDWERRASTDPDRVTRCWQAGAYNIGLATGPARLVVIDLDAADDTGPAGADALAELAARRGVPVPTTYTVATPSGGQHLYFTSPPGVHLRNSAGTLGPHIDTRAHGGYVVAPDSTLPTGAYELTEDCPPVELPAWIIQALLERPATPTAPVTLTTARRPAYVAAALHGETDRIRQAPPNQHNAALSRASFALGQLTGAGLLDTHTARAALLDAAQTLVTANCQCTPREVTRVIDTALAAGARHPRTITERPVA